MAAPRRGDRSNLDKGRGPGPPPCWCKGTLRRGDFRVCGVQYGRVRAMFDENGQQVERPARRFRCSCSAGRACPTPATTSSSSPTSAWPGRGAAARAKRRETRLVAKANLGRHHGADDRGRRAADAEPGGQGGCAGLGAGAARDAGRVVERPDPVNVIVSGVGGITEVRRQLWRPPPRPPIIGFNVRRRRLARKVIESNGLDLRYFSIIYDVIDQVKRVASGRAGQGDPRGDHRHRQVRDVFRSSKFGAVAGCMVIEGRGQEATARSACCATAW